MNRCHFNKPPTRKYPVLCVVTFCPGFIIASEHAAQDSWAAALHVSLNVDLTNKINIFVTALFETIKVKSRSCYLIKVVVLISYFCLFFLSTLLFSLCSVCLHWNYYRQPRLKKNKKLHLLYGWYLQCEIIRFASKPSMCLHTWKNHPGSVEMTGADFHLSCAVICMSDVWYACLSFP